MLDDLKFIHQRDSQDALGIAEKQWQQTQESYQKPDFGQKHFKNIVYGGMGGSALAALVSQSWPGYKVPFEVCRDYDIPGYISEGTLFIVSSYSGNTEETLSALAQAEERKATVVVITGGGKLEEAARTKNYSILKLPKVAQPRYAVIANLKAIVAATDAANLIAEDNALEQLVGAADFLKEAVKPWLPTVPTDQNPAKKLAMEIAGKSPVVYAGPFLAPMAYKWKINFNENSKNVAWWGEYPEFNHNEFIGWSSHPVDKPYSVIDLRSNLEHPRVQKRFEVSARLLSGRRPAPLIVEAQGRNKLEQLLWTMAFGDFVTIYLGLINNVDPAPVELVEKFKKELDN